MTHYVLFCIAFLLLCLAFWLFHKEHEFCGVAMLVVTMIFIISGYESTPARIAQHNAEKARDAAAEQQARTPHVIRQADGCRVYRFKDAGLYHYFTRCPLSTSTTGTREVCKNVNQGKTTVRKCELVQEPIPTEYTR